MNLSSFEERLLFTTVRIESLDEALNPVSTGTGFMIKKKLKDNGHKAYIISNKHVLSASSQFNIGFIKKKKNSNEPEMGEIKSYRFQYLNSFVELHPEKDVDIGIIDITGFIEKEKDDIYCQMLDYSMLATCEEDFLHVAQSTIFIGYPDGRYDTSTNLPLVRSAIIASHPYLDYDSRKIFIIDGQVFPGSSGSPVLINPFKERWISGYMPMDEPPILVLGIVAQTMIRNNKLQVLDTKQIDNAQVQEVLGLGIVFKSTSIKEVLDIATEKFFEGSTNEVYGMTYWREK